MDLMRAWLRRSVGATLLIPTGIILLAGLVAVVGGGLGGLTSLSQLAAGPTLPDAGSVIDSNPALDDSGLAGSPALGPAAAGGGAGTSAGGAGTGTTAASAGGGGAPAGGGGGESGGTQNPTETPSPPSATPTTPTSPGGETVTGPGLQPGPTNPLGGEVEDITSGLGDTLEPLQPVTDGLLDVLAPNR